MNTLPIVRRCFSILALASVLTQSALAYTYPLSSTQIRDAYFLGSGDPVKLGNFLEQYAKYYPTPKSGQYIYSIRFETPYYLIAERVGQPFSHYHAPDAELEFLGKAGYCRVRVEIFYGLSSHPVPYRTNYAVQLKQGDKDIAIEKTWTEGMLSIGDSGPTEDGEFLNVEYRADDIDSESPITVTVLGPDRSNVVETFDLARLK